MALKHVYSHRDGNALCDISDEVERLYGFGCTTVSVGAFGSYGSALYVDTRFPTWEKAFAYARELVAAAQQGREAYQSALRR